MKESTATPRIAQLKLDLGTEKPAVVGFDGDDITGNTGILLAAQIEKLTGLLLGASARLKDHRTQSMIKHSQFEEVAQRVYQILAGFAAGSDSDFLRNDPAVKMAVGRNPLTGEALASQPTQSRLENRRTYKELYELSKWLVEYYIQCHPKAPKKLYLDFDGSAIETFGVQLNAFYRGGPYQKNMYFPLFVFDQNGWLLVAALRPGDQGEVELALPVLKRLVKRLREAWPRTQIIVRADGAYTSNALYEWMDENEVKYVLGIKHNNALLAKTRKLRRDTEKKFKRKLSEPQFVGKQWKKRKNAKNKKIRSIKDPKERVERLNAEQARRVRLYGEFLYAARSWDRERRVIARCDYTDEGLKVRYVVTNIRGTLAPTVYEDIYCKRAVCELSIKNLKETGCTRMSCSQFKANMFRLLLHAMAYILAHQVRLKLGIPRMSIGELQRKLINVAAQVRETRTEVIVRISRAYQAAKDFRLVSKRLGATSLLAG